MKKMLLAIALASTQLVVGLDIQKLVDKSVEQGLIVATIDGNDVQYYSAGRFSKNNEQPIAPDTLFAIGGLTKTFTSLLLTDHVYRGKLQFDSPISIATNGRPVPTYNGKEITFEQLALHTSGLPYLPTNFSPPVPWDPYAGYHPSDLWEFLAGYELKDKPGCRYEDSEIGSGLLGYLLGRLDGTSYGRSLRDNVLRPLGLTDTMVDLTEEDWKRVAPGHSHITNVPYMNYSLVFQGCGALYSTAQDMVRFLQIQLNQIPNPLEWQINETHVPRFYICLNYRVGLGWYVEMLPRVFMHTSTIAGYQAYMAFDPWCNKAVLVLSNSNSAAIEVGERIVTSWFLWAEDKHQPLDLEDLD